MTTKKSDKKMDYRQEIRDMVYWEVNELYRILIDKVGISRHTSPMNQMQAFLGMREEDIVDAVNRVLEIGHKDRDKDRDKKKDTDEDKDKDWEDRKKDTDKRMGKS